MRMDELSEFIRNRRLQMRYYQPTTADTADPNGKELSGMFCQRRRGPVDLAR